MVVLATWAKSHLFWAVQLSFGDTDTCNYDAVKVEKPVQRKKSLFHLKIHPSVYLLFFSPEACLSFLFIIMFMFSVSVFSDRT